jgi:opacity protein-like surface antigen
MRARTLNAAVCLALVVTFAAASGARAQGALVSGAIGVADTDGSTDLAVTGGVAYRFNKALGLGIEISHLPRLGSDPFGSASLVICCGYAPESRHGHATIFTTNMRLEIPTTVRRVVPFVIAGGGVAGVSLPYPIYYAVPLAATASGASTAAGTAIPSILPGPAYVTNTTIAMALTLGGGASVLLTDHVAVDADLRAVRLIANDGSTMGRFSVGASYRF